MRPIRPKPMIPTPIRSLAPCARCHAAAVRAVAVPAWTKARRVMEVSRGLLDVFIFMENTSSASRHFAARLSPV